MKSNMKRVYILTDRQTDGSMDGLTDKRTDRWRDGWTDGQMDGRTDMCLKISNLAMGTRASIVDTYSSTQEDCH